MKNGDLQPGFAIYKRHLERLQSRLQFTLNMLEQGVDKIDLDSDETLLIDRAVADYLDGIKFRNGTIRWSYLASLGLKSSP